MENRIAPGPATEGQVPPPYACPPGPYPGGIGQGLGYGQPETGTGPPGGQYPPPQPPPQAWGGGQPASGPYGPPPGQPMYPCYPPPGYGPQYGMMPPPQQQQQQQQVIVMNGTGQHITHIQHSDNYCAAIVFACFVAWCCNWLFGLIAFILAMIASSTAVSDPHGAKHLARASYGVSIAGIVVTVVVIVIVVAVVVSSAAAAANTAAAALSSCSGYYSYSYGGTCYAFASTSYSSSSCSSYYYSSAYDSSSNTCYHD